MTDTVREEKGMDANGRDDQQMIDRLNTSFETFIEITEDLKQAYDRLRERADAMDLELKDANERLSEKVLELDGLSRQLNDLLQNMPGAVVAVSGDGCIIHFNRTAETLLGIDAETVLGNPIDEVETLDEMLLLGRDANAPLASDPEEERTIMTPNGRMIVVTSRISELRNAQGEPEGRIEILTDLTETDRLRREVHRLDTLAALGEMAAGVAHQIRNPLNGVEGFASLLQRKLAREGETANDDARRYAGKIVHGVREVNAIINGMLMLAKDESLDLRPVDMDRLAADVASRLEQSAESGGRNVEIDFRSGLNNDCLLADEIKLRQVLLNIGHNALEALDGEGPCKVRIRTSRSRGAMEVRITDTGKGMSQDEAGKIFHPFYTTRDAGTGLGLSVATKIVDLHEGAISVRSIPEVGTTFKVALRTRTPKGYGYPERSRISERNSGDKNDRACARCG